MTESIFVRVQRVLSASTDSCVAMAERASGSALMREAIRQVERAVDEIRAEQDSCRSRRADGERRQLLLRERLATLDEQARFALGKGREDLAAAALARQIEHEQEYKRLRKAETEAAAEAAKLDQAMRDLELRRAQMEQELADHQAACGSPLKPSAPTPAERARRRAERAEEAFERAMAAAGGNGAGLMETAEAAKLAEVEALQKEAAVAERLAALRAKQDRTGSAKSNSGGQRRKAG